MRENRNDEFIAELFSNDEYRRIVLRTIRRKVSNIRKHDLEDCLCDVMVIALEKDEDLSKHPNIHAWLTLAAKIVADRFLEKQKVTNDNIADLPEYAEQADPNSVEDTVESAEHEKQTRDFLKKNLSGADYELYVFKIIENRSIAEIATLLKEKEDTVKKRFTRLKVKLREIL
jgi:RNA polymerase sigma factor (sigma-70 family)